MCPTEVLTKVSGLMAPSSGEEQLFLRDQLFQRRATAEPGRSESTYGTRNVRTRRTQRGDEVNLSGAQLQMYILQKKTIILR